MSNKDLTEIVARNDVELKELVGKALYFQMKEGGITRGDFYKIASELNIPTKYAKKALKKDYSSLVDSRSVYDDNQIIKIIKKAKKPFEPKIYTENEISNLLMQHGIKMSENFLNVKYNTSNFFYHIFREQFVKNEGKCYKLVRKLRDDIDILEGIKY